MTNTHILEFWSYLSGLAPRHIAVQQKNILYCLEEDSSFPEIERGTCFSPTEIIDAIQKDVEKTWQEGLQANPRMSNNLKPNILRISDDGRTIEAAFATYKTSFWIKKRLSSYSPVVQESIADQFPFFNIGMVTVTADDQILLEQRPLNVTAGGMLLNYPCGYLSRGEQTLEDTVNAQAQGELGFAVLGANAREGVVTNISSLGMQRESDEWTPNYTFLMRLNIPASQVTPTKKTKHIVPAPADPEQLIAYLAERYSATIKGDVAGKLVPNATGMLALYVRSIGGEQTYGNLIDRLTETAQTQKYALRTVDYTKQTNRFR